MKGIIFLCILSASVCLGLPRHSVSQKELFSRIVGGVEVVPNSIPYQVSLQTQDYRSHFCGGSIIDEYTILTAAHCLELFDGYAKLVYAVVGEHNLFEIEGLEQKIQGKKVIMHETFDDDQLTDDIALLRLKTPIVFNDAVAPVPLPVQGREYEDGDIFQVSGWGTLSYGGSSPNNLRVVDVPYVTDEICRSSYGDEYLDDSMICAGIEGKDSCQGDSGGPMTLNGAIAGIVSWGKGCALDKYPGVYTQVSYFVDWINEHKYKA